MTERRLLVALLVLLPLGIGAIALGLQGVQPWSDGHWRLELASEALWLICGFGLLVLGLRATRRPGSRRRTWIAPLLGFALLSIPTLLNAVSIEMLSRSGAGTPLEIAMPNADWLERARTHQEPGDADDEPLAARLDSSHVAAELIYTVRGERIDVLQEDGSWSRFEPDEEQRAVREDLLRMETFMRRQRALARPLLALQLLLLVLGLALGGLTPAGPAATTHAAT